MTFQRNLASNHRKLSNTLLFHAFCCPRGRVVVKMAPCETLNLSRLKSIGTETREQLYFKQLKINEPGIRGQGAILGESRTAAAGFFSLIMVSLS